MEAIDGVQSWRSSDSSVWFPFLFLRAHAKRERAWLIGLSAIYLCLSVLMIVLLNPNPDRQTPGPDQGFLPRRV